MILGIDFDNTIVGYDNLFHRIAVERGLVPASLTPRKNDVRDFLRRQGREDDWTELQGHVYGPRMAEAQPFPGVREFFAAAIKRGLPIHIISHKTRAPVIGPAHDLHQAARDWLARQGFFDGAVGLSPDHVHFGVTRQEKIQLIQQIGCTHFVDDLEETFLEPEFPKDVVKLLFGRGQPPPVLPAVKCMEDWAHVSAYVHKFIDCVRFDSNEEVGKFSPAHSLPAQKQTPEEMRAGLSRLLNGEITGIERIGGGRNSQVYKVTSQTGPTMALKVYFRHPDDKRDRLATEFNSFRYLWANGFREIPGPLVSEAKLGWAVYQFIDGDKVLHGQAGEGEIQAAVDFLDRLRTLSRNPESRKLGLASEAFFAVSQVAQNVRHRLERLQSALGGAKATYKSLQTGMELHELLSDNIAPFLETAIPWSQKRLEAAGNSFDQDLDWSQRTLSPSDFGFHNALRQPDGRIIFLDFEYFGWDDPAKMVADFLLHPAMELSSELKKSFVSTLFSRFADWPHLVGRVEAVYPLFGLKWCMILLNEFLPESLQRRKFAATNSADIAELQRQQLDKARRMLHRIKEEYEAFPYK